MKGEIMKSKNIIWGIYFILAAVLVIFYQLGSFAGIGIPSFVFTVLLIPIIFQSVRHLNFFGIVFPIALLLIVFKEPLGIGRITPWPVLVGSLFLTIGLELIFQHKKNYRTYNYHSHHNWHGRYHDKYESVDNIDDNNIKCEVNLGSGSKYLNSTSLEKAYFKCSFGGLKVYFDNAKLHPDGAQVFIDNSFGGVELYIPGSWTVVVDVDATFGGVDEKYRKNTPDGPVLTISGRVSFGGIEIIYV